MLIKLVAVVLAIFIVPLTEPFVLQHFHCCCGLGKGQPHCTGGIQIYNNRRSFQSCFRVGWVVLERFSFECRKVIGFAFSTLCDWLKKLAPLFHPIRSKTKIYRDSLVRVFPHFASATCNYFVF